MASAARTRVLVIVPPNTNTVFEGRLLTVTRPEEHSDWSDFMSLGVLGLVCALRSVERVRAEYIDGTIIEFPRVLDHISRHSDEILAVCVGVLTANYEAGLRILRHAKALDPAIHTIIGNDHFTALPEACMRGAPCIDYGFVGNEVVGPFTRLVATLAAGEAVRAGDYPSLVHRVGDEVRVNPSRPEAVFRDYDYALIDTAFEHAPLYTAGFRKRIAPRVKELLGRTVQAGVPVDIGRGCVKFANNNACSFCSIQYGGMWRNSLGADDAWEAIRRAVEAGYDYLYLTADELPLTFGALLAAMIAAQPRWWRDIPPDERPLMVGYARADGIADRRRTEQLLSLGVRQVMIGMDAGSPISLAAMNKPLRMRGAAAQRSAEILHGQNHEALTVARDSGMLIRAGFVLGHIGMTPALLAENVDMIKGLIRAGRDIISALDIEVLSPQPGSLDFEYLTRPEAALRVAETLGVPVGARDDLERVAANWRGSDVVIPELAMRDFADALMPGIEFDRLAEARGEIRGYAKSLGVVIGE